MCAPFYFHAEARRGQRIHPPSRVAEGVRGWVFFLGIPPPSGEGDRRAAAVEGAFRFEPSRQDAKKLCNFAPLPCSGVCRSLAGQGGMFCRCAPAFAGAHVVVRVSTSLDTNGCRKMSPPPPRSYRACRDMNGFVPLPSTGGWHLCVPCSLCASARNRLQPRFQVMDPRLRRNDDWGALAPAKAAGA